MIKTSHIVEPFLLIRNKHLLELAGDHFHLCHTGMLKVSDLSCLLAPHGFPRARKCANKIEKCRELCTDKGGATRESDAFFCNSGNPTIVFTFTWLSRFEIQ